MTKDEYKARLQAIDNERKQVADRLHAEEIELFKQYIAENKMDGEVILHHPERGNERGYFKYEYDKHTHYTELCFVPFDGPFKGQRLWVTQLFT